MYGHEYIEHVIQSVNEVEQRLNKVRADLKLREAEALIGPPELPNLTPGQPAIDRVIKAIEARYQAVLAATDQFQANVFLYRIEALIAEDQEQRPVPEPEDDLDIERFWKKVDIQGPPDYCWTWTGAKPNGTRSSGGTVIFHGKWTSAARIAWLLERGELYPSQILRRNLKLCRNRQCVKPAHHRIVLKK